MLSRLSVVLVAACFALPLTATAQEHRANFELAERFTTQQLDKMVGSTRDTPPTPDALH
ncbi:MAG: hypothetical protein AAGJ10_21215 [Bacteroidota bacterium]